MSSILLWTCISIVIVISTADLTFGHRGAGNPKKRERFLGQQALPLPTELRPVILERLHQRERAIRTGGFVGVGIGTVAASIANVVQSTDTAPFIMLIASFGMALGSFRGARATAATLDPAAPRVARLSATELSDYTTRGEELAVKIAPAMTVVALLAALAVWWAVPVRPGGGWWVPAALVLATVASFVLMAASRRATRVVVERPQQAHSDLELAWDDALRASAVRDLQGSTISIGLVTSALLLVAAASWVLPTEVRRHGWDLTMYLGMAAFCVGCACWLAVLVPWVTGQQDKNPSRQLWAGQRFEVHA